MHFITVERVLVILEKKKLDTSPPSVEFDEGYLGMCTMVAQVCDADYHDLLGVEEGFMWSIFPDWENQHIGIYLDNMPLVVWTTKMASKRSKVTGKLLRALTM